MKFIAHSLIGVHAILLTVSVAQASPTDYVATYVVTEKDVRSAQYRDFELKSLKAPDPNTLIAPNVDPNTRSELLASLTQQIKEGEAKRLQEIKTVSPDLKYDADISLHNGSFMCRVKARESNSNAQSSRPSPVPGSEFVVVFDKRRNETTSIIRLPSSAADTYINKGLDTRKLPFLLVTDERLPFVKMDGTVNEAKIPVQAGSQVGEAGEVAKPFYQVFKREQRGGDVVLTYADEKGTWEVWTLRFGSSDAIGKSLPASVEQTIFTWMNDSNASNKATVTTPLLTRTATLVEVKQNDIESMFRLGHWMKTGDVVQDYRTMPKKSEVYDAKLGQLMEQKKTANTRVIAFFTALPLLFIALWFHVRKNLGRGAIR